MLLSARAMLANVHISVWSARKFDRKVSTEVTTDKNASDDAGRFNKHLLAGQDSKLKVVQKEAQKVRQYHYENTLPWGRDGARLLPTKKYLEYEATMVAMRQGFKEAVLDFLDSYPAAVEAAKVTLGEMYDAADFPHVSELKHKFDFVYSFSPVPQAGDFRVELPDHIREELENHGALKTKAAYKDALKDAWGRLYDVIEAAHERLKDPEAIFRDSLISNIKETAGIVKDLNIMDEPDLAEAADKAISELTEWDPLILRKNAKVRSATADKAKELLDRVAGCM